MLEQLRARLAELEDLETRGVEQRIDYPSQPSRADEIEELRGRIASYDRLSRLATQGKNAKTRNV
jgi:hypothetical protein